MPKLPKPKNISGQTLVLNLKSPWTALGPHSYENCEFQLSTTWRAFAVTHAAFKDCVFVAKKPLKNFQGWEGAFLKNCRFSGAYIANWFGAHHLAEPAGFVESCDFSDATLDDCRFYSCDASQIAFPKEHFLGICNPSQHIPRLHKDVPTPETASFLSIVPVDDNELSVYTSDLRELQRSLGLVPDELVAWLTRMDVPILWS